MKGGKTMDAEIEMLKKQLEELGNRMKLSEARQEVLIRALGSIAESVSGIKEIDFIDIDDL